MNIKFVYKKIVFLLLLVVVVKIGYGQIKVTVDPNRRGNLVDPSMYGVFFEEINHAGEGGIYPDMIQNRAFEEHVIPSGFTYRIENGQGKVYAVDAPSHVDGEHKHFNWNWNIEEKKYQAWTIFGPSDGVVYDVGIPKHPLHPNTPNALKLNIKSADKKNPVVVANNGFWGISLKKDKKYKLRFYLFSENYNGNVYARIVDSLEQKSITIKTFNVKKVGKWLEYLVDFEAGEDIHKGQFQLQFTGKGICFIDYVSLLPQDTYKNHGLRSDICQYLADLHPAFMRWPGGCVVEGSTLENRIKWKETLGDPMQRKGEYMRWGYRSSMGFGYHEYLQLCEDIGANAMFVGNVGMACNFENGDFAPESDYDFFVQDIKDAIEYAIGDINTIWGAKRAANGHPKPFPLKYIELGNEHWSAHYAKVHDYFYSRLKPLYPQLTFISTYGMADIAANPLAKVDMLDPHWYVKPEFFYENVNLFDRIERGNYTIYVGEYAANQDVGTGNMDAALSEAVFLTGMERNADLVKLASYAPLLTNVNKPNWSCNLIWFNNEKTIGRASYYVQQIFSQNRPDYTVFSDMDSLEDEVIAKGRIQVIAGIDTVQNEIVIKVINAKASSLNLNFDLNNVFVQKKGQVITLASDALDQENSIDEPRRIFPIRSSFEKFASQFDYPFKPNSLTVLRIKIVQ